MKIPALIHHCSRTTRSSVLLLTLWVANSFALEPSTVTVAGSFQSAVGCAGDWQPDCAATHLLFDSEDEVWQEIFNIPPGYWEYKAAINDSWDENYGIHATRNGANISLYTGNYSPIKFYYDPESHWITDNINSVIVTAPGNYQAALGCGSDWDPSCLKAWLEDPDGDGIYERVMRGLVPGNYETRIAINESWAENYGAGGVANGPNISFTVPGCVDMLFRYDGTTHILTVTVASGQLPQPASVTVVGSFQDIIGCAGIWQPDCNSTHLAFDGEDGVWQNWFSLPAGTWEYKAALNDSFDENYGMNGIRNGQNISFNLPTASAVKFYYDQETHWITDNRSSIIVTAPGSYQSEEGCGSDWDPSCLKAWLLDVNGDGIYERVMRHLPAGSYETKVAIDESWSENYGVGGQRDGPNIAFTVPVDCMDILFQYDSATHILTVTPRGWNEPPVVICPEPQTIACASTSGTDVELAYEILDPEGGPLEVFWSVDGEPIFIPITTGPPEAPVLHLSLAAGYHVVSIDVSDGLNNTTCDVAANIVHRCPQPQGYWKQNSSLWPVSSLQLGAQTYTQKELLKLLGTAVGKDKNADASIVLAYQLIAAKLNLANCADPAPIASTISAADGALSTLSGKLPYSIRPNTPLGKQLTGWATTLASYNEGLNVSECMP